VVPFDVSEFKEYLDKVKKIHYKIRSINDFQAYDLDHHNGIRTRDIQEIIEVLKYQHDFIYETENLHKMYVQIK